MRFLLIPVFDLHAWRYYIYIYIYTYTLLAPIPSRIAGVSTHPLPTGLCLTLGLSQRPGPIPSQLQLARPCLFTYTSLHACERVSLRLAHRILAPSQAALPTCLCSRHAETLDSQAAQHQGQRESLGSHAVQDQQEQAETSEPQSAKGCRLRAKSPAPLPLTAV